VKKFFFKQNERYLQEGLHAELLDIESPLLESFLRATDPAFLAEYFTANHRFSEVSKLFVKIFSLSKTN
jgi:hypothetical protein